MPDSISTGFLAKDAGTALDRAGIRCLLLAFVYRSRGCCHLDYSGYAGSSETRIGSEAQYSRSGNRPARMPLTFHPIELTKPKRPPCMVILIADRAREEEMIMSTLHGNNTAFASGSRRISPQDSLAKVHISIFNELKDVVDKYLDEMISDVRNARAAMGAWSPVVNEAEQILIPIKWLQTWVFIAAAQKRAEDPSDQDMRRPPASTEKALSELAFRSHLDPEVFLKQRYDLETQLGKQGLKRGDAAYDEAIMRLNVSQLKTIEAARKEERHAVSGGMRCEEIGSGTGSVRTHKGS